jgi:2-polyprenyl-3-methyl-5-hydroxy-6-metoxy-1,4-benzoquinol methylase
MANKHDVDEAVRRWDRHARELMERFGEEGDLHRVALLNPVLLDLLGDVNGRDVLDAGCGEGYLGRMLAARGARVTAVDVSGEMLAIARERTPEGAAIDYVQASCEDLRPLGDGAFDVVVSNMVLQDLAGYEAALREFARVLRPGGRLIFSILHPCFSAPGCGWIRNYRGDRLLWRSDNYFREGPYEQPWPLGAPDGVIGYHRTLTSYFAAARRAGFSVDLLIEPKPSDEVLAKYPGFRDDLRMAHFIVFGCVKG